MSSLTIEAKNHHVVLIPFPAQGHINPMLKIANLLHSRGFHITFLHTKFNFDRLRASLGSDHPSLKDSLDGSFRFETIPDGLPPDNKRGVNELQDLVSAFPGEPKAALKALLIRLRAGVPPLSCVISDALMNFTYDVGVELGIRTLRFYTPSACSSLGFLHYDQLVSRGLFPLKDESCLTNGYLETTVEWIPGLIKGAKLKHLPSFVRSTNPRETMFLFNIESSRVAVLAGSIIINTFDELEADVLEAMKAKIPNISTIGPLHLLCQQANLKSSGLNLWKEDTKCFEWLDKRSPKSVIYVNYGSFTTLTSDQLKEFAWGLANSKQYFFWVIRDDMVSGESRVLSEDYFEEIKERGLVSSWCDQERVLKHPSVRAFLTHCGWNSTLESIGEGIPMICWPFFADQQTNCFYACDGWGVGVVIEEGDVKRERIEELVREMMEGETGKRLTEKAIVWKQKAVEATTVGGSSHNNFENLVKLIMETNHG